jgi:hypothetical protein
MNRYLIVYDRRAGAIVAVEEFDTSEREKALPRRFELERAYRGRGDIEIVVLAADSREELLTTHARYFRTLEELTQSAG